MDAQSRDRLLAQWFDAILWQANVEQWHIVHAKSRAGEWLWLWQRWRRRLQQPNPTEL